MNLPSHPQAESSPSKRYLQALTNSALRFNNTAVVIPRLIQLCNPAQILNMRGRLVIRLTMVFCCVDGMMDLYFWALESEEHGSEARIWVMTATIDG